MFHGHLDTHAQDSWASLQLFRVGGPEACQHPFPHGTRHSSLAFLRARIRAPDQGAPLQDSNCLVDQAPPNGISLHRRHAPFHQSVFQGS